MASRSGIALFEGTMTRQGFWSHNSPFPLLTYLQPGKLRKTSLSRAVSAARTALQSTDYDADYMNGTGGGCNEDIRRHTCQVCPRTKYTPDSYGDLVTPDCVCDPGMHGLTCILPLA